MRIAVLGVVLLICHVRCIGCACGFGLLEVVLFDGAFVLDVWHFGLCCNFVPM